jgi:integrase
MARVPKYALHKASGRAFCKIDGQYHYLGKHGSPESLQAYAAIIFERTGKAPPPIADPKNLTIPGLISAFLSRNQAEYAPGSREPKQFTHALLPLARVCKSVRAADFQAHHLDSVRKAMANGSWLTAEEKAAYAKRKRAVCWCREVINRRVARIKLMFKRCELWGLVPPGTHARLSVITGSSTKALPSPDTEPASWGDVKRLAVFLSRPGKGRHKERAKRLAALLLTLWWSGARPGEIRIMRAGDVDRSGEVWIYRPETHKNAWRGQTREIALGPKCQAVLKSLMGDDPTAYLFPSRRGPGPYSEWGLSNAIRKAGRAAGITLHAYQLRHAGKRRIETEHGEAAAKAFLGQESLESTRKYARTHDAALARKVARTAG